MPEIHHAEIIEVLVAVVVEVVVVGLLLLLLLHSRSVVVLNALVLVEVVLRAEVQNNISGFIPEISYLLILFNFYFYHHETTQRRCR